MGIIIAKFRKKKNTYEILEKLQNEIGDIEEFSRTTENTKRKIVGRFIALALTTYILLALGVYFYYHRISPHQKLIYTVPLIAVPVVIYVIKTFLTWYYGRKIRKNQTKLVKLKEEKKKILEKVEETETYKVAKEILDKFGEPNKMPLIAAKDSTPATVSKSVSNVNSVLKPFPPGLRQRTAGSTDVKFRLSFGPQDKNAVTPLNHNIINKLGTPLGRTPALAIKGPTGYTTTPSIGVPVPSTSSALQLPRPVLPLRKTIVDKMFDYLVGDGPSNRYALICRSCFNHNGMAFKEEFEYLSFNCCYCGFFNPSRKKRPSGPKFEPTVSPSLTITHSSDSDISSDESSSKPIITEITDPPNVTRMNSGAENSAEFDVGNTNDRVSPQEIPIELLEYTEMQDRGDSQISFQDKSKNPFEPNATSLEDGDSGNPFGEYDSENETLNTQRDSGNVDDLVKTKED